MTHCVSFKKVSVLYNIYCILIICGVVIPCMAFIMVRIIGGKSSASSTVYGRSSVCAFGIQKGELSLRLASPRIAN